MKFSSSGELLETSMPLVEKRPTYGEDSAKCKALPVITRICCSLCLLTICTPNLALASSGFAAHANMLMLMLFVAFALILFSVESCRQFPYFWNILWTSVNVCWLLSLFVVGGDVSLYFVSVALLFVVQLFVFIFSLVRNLNVKNSKPAPEI